MENVRFGIVGCGMIARYHALAISDTARAVLIGAYSCSRVSAEARLCARKTVILKNCYFTASVEQDWETNEHTAFSFG